MTDTDLAITKAKRYAYEHFMAHAYYGAGYISFVAAFVLTIAFGIFSVCAAIPRHQANIAMQYAIMTGITGSGASILIIVWHRLHRKAACFSDDAIENGNLTEADIRSFFDNYSL